MVNGAKRALLADDDFLLVIDRHLHQWPRHLVAWVCLAVMTMMMTTTAVKEKA